jgi:galactokinase
MKPALLEKFRAIYGRSPEIVSRAPGRIEFIGNHTDYNGGTVLGAAIDRGIWVALARRDDSLRQFASDQRGAVIKVPANKMDRLTGDESWVNYPLGVIAALPVFKLRAPQGFDYLAMSDLPAGAGLSSSAAIEMASALAFVAATGEQPARETLVKAARHAENNFVGVPCGILDQGVSGFGRKDHLVFIDCRGPFFTTVPMPADAHFWIFNTHTKHALVDGLYAARHRECMEAAQALGVSLLVDASAVMLATAENKLSPIALKRARHIIEEIARVTVTAAALRAGDLAAAGQLLTASHRSSQMLFENSTEELDFLVDTAITLPHVFGARLTGGGFGGAVMVLTSEKFGDREAQQIATRYAGKYGEKPDILHMRTGEGAALL